MPEASISWTFQLSELAHSLFYLSQLYYQFYLFTTCNQRTPRKRDLRRLILIIFDIIAVAATRHLFRIGTLSPERGPFSIALFFLKAILWSVKNEIHKYTLLIKHKPPALPGHFEKKAICHLLKIITCLNWQLLKCYTAKWLSMLWKAYTISMYQKGPLLSLFKNYHQPTKKVQYWILIRLNFPTVLFKNNFVSDLWLPYLSVSVFPYFYFLVHFRNLKFFVLSKCLGFGSVEITTSETTP